MNPCAPIIGQIPSSNIIHQLPDFVVQRKSSQKKKEKKKEKEIFEIFVRDPIRAKSFEYVTVIKYLAPFASCFRFVVVPWLIVSKIWVSIVGLAGQSGFFHFPWSGNFVSVDGNQLIVLGPEPFVRSFCFYTRHVIFYVNPVRSGNRSSCCGGIHSFLFSFFSLFIIVYCIPTDILTVFFFFFFLCVCSRRAQNGGDLNSTTGTTNHLSKYWTLTKTIRWSIRTLDDVIRHLIGFFFRIFSFYILDLMEYRPPLAIQ